MSFNSIKPYRYEPLPTENPSGDPPGNPELENKAGNINLVHLLCYTSTAEVGATLDN